MNGVVVDARLGGVALGVGVEEADLDVGVEVVVLGSCTWLYISSGRAARM